MSVLEVMNRVRRAEDEADGLLEEARLREKEYVAAARDERRALLERAGQEAAREIRNLERLSEEEGGRLLNELDAKAAEEQEETRSLAAGNADKASALAIEIFNRLYLKR